MLIPAIQIEADKPRNLRFGAGAVYRLERQYSKPITDILAELVELSSAKRMRMGLLLDFIVAGCQHEDPSLTAEKLADALSVPELVALVPKVGEAIRAAFPPAKEALPNAIEQTAP